MSGEILRVRTPAEIAAASVRLRQAGAEHHAAVLRRAMDGELCAAFLPPDGDFPRRLMVRCRKPLMLVLCDDGDVSHGPSRFPQARRQLRWAKSIVLHAAAGHPWHYDTAADAAVLSGRLVLVECAAGGPEAEWLALIMAAAPRTPLLRITPPPGASHPTMAVPAGATVQ